LEKGEYSYQTHLQRNDNEVPGSTLLFQACGRTHLESNNFSWNEISIYQYPWKNFAFLYFKGVAISTTIRT